MSDEGSQSLRTVIVAGLVNLSVAVAKAVTGLLSGSAAMLSEAVHSLADTTTEVLLFIAVRRGTAPPDETHQFGYGRAGFLWALVAAAFTFVAGGGFAVTQGIHTIVGRRGGQPLRLVVRRVGRRLRPGVASRWRRVCGRRVVRPPACGWAWDGICGTPPTRRSRRWSSRTGGPVRSHPCGPWPGADPADRLVDV